jgi:endonuclease/exonuclease/phosphatase family metal-dependent hydrolase
VLLLAACGDDGAPDELPEPLEDAGSAVQIDAGRDASGPSLDARVPPPVPRDAGLPGEGGSGLPGLDGGAPDLSLRMLTYNVAGLPEGISQSNPARNSGLISPLLNDYALALLQEDFSYHAAIVSAAKHPFLSPVNTSGQSLGDGLSFLSQAPFEDFERIAWADCFGVFDSGSDCLTPKGFTFARFRLSPTISLDVYDVHADAGSAAGDFAAREKNLRQLASAINTRSVGRAVLVAGDLNSRYSRAGDIVPALLESAQLEDVWLELVRNGQRPVVGMPATCSDTELDDPACERIDKVLYRSSSDVRLLPVAYVVEGQRFSDADGAQLSDHRPVSVRFDITRVH